MPSKLLIYYVKGMEKKKKKKKTETTEGVTKSDENWNKNIVCE